MYDFSCQRNTIRMMQPDNLWFAFLLRDAVVHCSLAPVIAQFVADGNMEDGW